MIPPQRVGAIWLTRPAVETHRDEYIARWPVKSLAQLAPWHAVRRQGGRDAFYATANINGT